MPVRVFLLVLFLFAGFSVSARAAERLPGSYFLDGFKNVDVLEQPIEMADIDLAQPGGTVSMAKWHGKWVIFNIWATWCPPCVAELPELDRLKFRKSGRGIDVLAVSIDRKMDADRIAYFLKRYHSPHLVPLYDQNRVLGERLDTGMLPVTYVINPNGQAVAALYGPAKWSSQHAQAFLDALVQYPDLLSHYVKRYRQAEKP